MKIMMLLGNANMDMKKKNYGRMYLNWTLVVGKLCFNSSSKIQNQKICKREREKENNHNEMNERKIPTIFRRHTRITISMETSGKS